MNCASCQICPHFRKGKGAFWRFRFRMFQSTFGWPASDIFGYI